MNPLRALVRSRAPRLPLDPSVAAAEQGVRAARRRALGTTALDVLGGGLVVFGVALVFVPAALVLAGVGVLAASWRASR